MATYVVTAANWNSSAFWSSISVSGGGHTLDLSSLPANFTVNYNELTGTLILSDGVTTYRVGDASGSAGPYNATLGGGSLFESFDIWSFGAGDNTVQGNLGNETINLGDGFNVYYDAAGSDTVTGGTGTDQFIVTEGSGTNNLFTGGGGNDYLALYNNNAAVSVNVTWTGADSGTYVYSDGSSGSFVDIDYIYADSGNDTFNASAATDGVYIWASGGNDSITGSNFGDVLLDGSGTDTVLGGGGDDTFYAYSGNDIMSGGTGSDIFFVGSGDGRDTITGGENAGDSDEILFDGNERITVNFTSNEAGTYEYGVTGIIGSFSQIEDITGTAFNDVLNASVMTTSISLDGGAGNDTLRSGSGNDTLSGGAGNDSIVAGTGADIMFGGAGVDTFVSTDGNDTIFAGDDNDVVNAAGTNNVISGGSGNDTLNSGTGSDTIDGGSGNDSITSSGTGPDFLVGGTGQDTIIAGDGNDTILGDSVSDIGTQVGTVSSVNLSTANISETGNTGSGTIGQYAVYDNFATAADGTIVQARVTVVDADDPSIVVTFGNGVTINDDGTSAAGTGVKFQFEFFNQLTGEPIRISGDLTVQDIDTTAESVSASSSDVDSVSVSSNPVSALTVTQNGEFITAQSDGTSSSSADENHWAEFAFTDQQTMVFEVTSRSGLTIYNFVGSDFTNTPTTTATTPSSNNDSILAGGGNDLIDGGLGSDTIDAGAGNDTIIGSEGGDLIQGGTGQDYLDYSTSDAAVNVNLSTGVGLGGTAQGDTISGVDGLIGSAFDDTLTGFNGESTVAGSAYTNDFHGGAGNDLLSGLGGSDSLYGDADNDTILGGTGNDYLYGGTGDDSIVGGDGDDTIFMEDGFGNDTIIGSETAEVNGDTLDLTAITTGVTVNLTSADPEAGTVSDGTSTASFVEIENIVLSGGRDTVVLADGSGSDTVAGFDLTDSGDGTANDQLDVSGLTDALGYPVNTDDVTVTDDGAGNAVLTFPNGEAITLLGVAPAQLSTPAQLAAIGIPQPNYIVEGTAGNDIIDASYTGDPEGDRIDALDHSDGSNNDSVVAGAGNDSVIAGAGDDTVFGEDGSDTLLGGDGNDSLDGGAGNDLIDGGAGNDTMIGDTGNDTFDGGAGDDQMFGGAGDDIFIVTEGNDQAFGGGDSDIFVAEQGFGNATIVGGETGVDYDSVNLNAVTSNLTIDLSGVESGTFTDGVSTGTFSEIEEVSLGAGRDTIILADGSGNDTVAQFDMTNSGDGTTNDQLDVSGMTDAGGYPVNTADVTVTDDGSGNAVLTFPNGESITLLGVTPAQLSTQAQLESIGIPAPGPVDGTAGNDTMTVGYTDAQGDIIDGTDGLNDTIYGYGGNDSIDAGAGDDTVEGGNGADTILGGTGNDLISGQADADQIVLVDGFGNDTVIGGETVTNGTDADLLDMSGVTSDLTVTATGAEAGGVTDGVNTVTFSEIEQISTGSGNDLVDMSADATGVQVETNDGNDTIIDGSGNDTLTAGAGDDSVTATTGDDVLSGGAGNDTLSGGAGSDTLDGGDGNDLLLGGEGADSILGLGGDDTIALENTFGNDTIVGGETGETSGDTLDLSAVTTGLTVNLTSADPEAGTVSDGISTATFSEIETVVLGGGRDTIVLADGSGSDSVTAFDMTDSGDGTTNDQLDVSGLTSDGGTTPVTTADVVVTDDGSGNAVLTFPGGESITLIGVAPSQVDSAAELVSIGIPDGRNWIVEGTAGSDTIDATYTGDPQGDLIDSGDGNPLTPLVGDNDSVLAGAGDDVVLSGLGNDTVLGGDGADTINGMTGDDLLDGGADGDTFVIDAGFGNDTVIGGETVTTGTDTDVLQASLADFPAGLNVTYTGSEAGTLTDGTSTLTFSEIERLELSDGNDTVDGTLSATGVEAFGFGGDDLLTGGDGNDWLVGGTGADTLSGGTGLDTLDGGDGNDVINAGSGDVVSGGDGNDTFNVSAANVNGTALTITGGETGEIGGDTLNITGPATINMTGAESGTVIWLDGTVLTFSEIENINYIPCFTPGTRIKTARGEVDAAHISVGDRVLTRDNGYQVVRWCGHRRFGAATVAATQHLRPVRIRAGALGNGLPERDMLVSPQHRVMMSGPRVQLLTGEDEVLVAAIHLVGRPGIEQVSTEGVTYVHFMFDSHELVMSDGAWTESFQPGDRTMGALDRAQRAELIEIFPELADGADGVFQAARSTVSRHEAALLA